MNEIKTTPPITTDRVSKDIQESADLPTTDQVFAWLAANSYKLVDISSTTEFSPYCPTCKGRLAQDVAHQWFHFDTGDYSCSISKATSELQTNVVAALQNGYSVCRSGIAGHSRTVVEIHFRELRDAQTVHQWLATIALATAASTQQSSEASHNQVDGVERGLQPSTESELSVSEVEVAMLDAIPSNWLDPLLTGKDAVIGRGPWGCPDIEKLLRAIKARQQEAAAAIRARQNKNSGSEG